MRLLICFFISIPLLIGCTNSVQVDEINLKNSSRESFSINDHHFEIIPYYDGYIEYIENIDNAASNSQLFKEEVLVPLSKELTLGNLENDPHFSLPNDMGKLKESLLGLDSKQGEIFGVIKESLEDVTELLKGGDYNIYIIPFYSGYNSEDVQGVAAFAVESGAIVLQIDPLIFTVESIKYAIAHEYHHVVVMESSAYKSRSQNLLDQIILEGKADIFTKKVYPEYAVPWIEPLEESESNIVLDFVKEHKNSYRIEDLHKMQIGSSYEGIPRWSNYKLGFQIMQNYIDRNPNVPIEEWTYYSAEDIVGNTDYASNLQ